MYINHFFNIQIIPQQIEYLFSKNILIFILQKLFQIIKRKKILKKVVYTKKTLAQFFLLEIYSKLRNTNPLG